MQNETAEGKAEGQRAKQTCRNLPLWLANPMSVEPIAMAKPVGKVVTADTLTVAAGVLGQPLAEPWRRLLGILIDLAVISLLSLLSKPFLAAATGLLLLVLLGNATPAPVGLKVLRLICRVCGVVVIVFSVLALGHVDPVRSGAFHFEPLLGESASAVTEQPILAPPNASYTELQSANHQLSDRLAALKAENEQLREASKSWVYQMRGLIGAMGVTFGWAGVYFSLLTGMTNGRTLGKYALRTRVLKVNGTPIRFFDAFIRQGGYVAGVAMGMIGFLKLLWEPNRQAVEDRIASTIVVKN